jgi:Pectate lyase superfamily protein
MAGDRPSGRSLDGMGGTVMHNLADVRWSPPSSTWLLRSWMVRVAALLLIAASLKAAAPVWAASAAGVEYVVNVRDMGARGDGVADDSGAIQAAINAAQGRPVYLPAGGYLIKSPLQSRTSGYAPGLKLFGDGILLTTIIPAFSEGDVVHIEAAVKPYTFQLGGWIRDLSIEGAGNRGDVNGISLTGAWMVSLERLRIQHLSGSAIRFPLRTDINRAIADPYASEFVSIRQSEFSFNRGWGVDGENGLGAGALIIEQCRIGYNNAGGIHSGGHDLRVINNAIFSNGQPDGGGLVLDYINGNSNGSVIEGNEFDTNYLYQIWVKGGDSFRISQNRFNSWATVFHDGLLHPAVHIRLGGSPGHVVRDFEISHNYHRSQYRRTGAPSDQQLSLYQVMDNNVAYGKISDPWVPLADNTPLLIPYSKGGRPAMTPSTATARLGVGLPRTAAALPPSAGGDTGEIQIENFHIH